MSISSDLETLSAIETHWSDVEFCNVNLGDKRLNERLLKLSKDMTAQPSSPINQCSGDWASTKSAYNFFANEKVTPSNLLAPHFSNTQRRMQSYSRVLAIQDTTTLNYTAHKSVEGLGNIGNEHAVGFMQHNVLALSPEGLPLGLIDQYCWSRSPDSIMANKGKDTRSQSIEEKESFRWINSLRNTQARCPVGVEVITICDREGDMYELFDEACQLGAKYIIRLQHDRALIQAGQHIKSHVQQQPVVGSYSFTVPAKKGEYPSREATVDVRAAALTINAPIHLKSQVNNQQLDMHVIMVKEVNAPEGIEPIEWYLVTNCTLDDECTPVQVVTWYRLRWLVEIFHKTEKSTCKVEECRLGTKERLQNYLALNSILAWRILYMTYIARVNPNAKPQDILSTIEIAALEHKMNLIEQRRCSINNTNAKIKTIKNVRQAIRAIATLGGFLGRKLDGEPGIIAMARGLERLADVVDGVIIKAKSANKLMGNR